MSIQELLDHIRLATLPGIIAHQEMSFTNRNFQKPKNAIKSAVSVLLYKKDHQIYFPLIKRPGHIRHHKNQIALPGGRVDNDESIEMCAIRETEEEMGILHTQIIPVRQLTDLYIPVSNHIVFPVLCYTDVEPKFVLNTKEVEKIIICSMGDLLSFEKQISRVKIKDETIIEVPSFIYHQEIIWGATALILNELKYILSSMYV